MKLSHYKLEKLRGCPLDDEDVSEIIDVFGPSLAVHGIAFCNNSEKGKKEEVEKSKIKTFVSNDYQVTLEDNGSVEVYLWGIRNLKFMYNPEGDYRWYMSENNELIKRTNYISFLGLTKIVLEKLHKALELGGRQDLMDREIVFVENK